MSSSRDQHSRNRTYPSKGINTQLCRDVMKSPRIFEARSACLWKYITELDFIVYSQLTTIPILLSFINYESAHQWALESVQLIATTFLNERDRTKYIELMSNIFLDLIDLNRDWNTQLPEEQKNKIATSLQLHKVYGNRFYDSTIIQLNFLTEIMGVIDKQSFTENSNYYVQYRRGRRYEKIYQIFDIDYKQDNKCKQTRAERCNATYGCKLRNNLKGKSQCVSEQRYRSITSGDDDTSKFYIQEYSKNKLVCYEPICIYNIASRNSGIFRQYDVVEHKILRKSNRVSIVFPPFQESTTMMLKIFNVFYIGGYIRNVFANESGHAKEGNVGIQSGLWSLIENWYNNCKDKLEYYVKHEDHIYITGTSFGGALCNVAAFMLIQKGYKNIHMYAFGSPRVGDEKFKNYMENANLMNDSANYVRFVNVVKKNKFYTEFDPMTKFPPNEWSILGHMGRHLRFVDNPRIRIMGGGYTFNPVFNTFNSQPDYNIHPLTKLGRKYFAQDDENATPIGLDCANHFPYVHSLKAYGSLTFVGMHNYAGPDYYVQYQDRDHMKSYDIVRNLSRYPCKGGIFSSHMDDELHHVKTPIGMDLTILTMPFH